MSELPNITGMTLRDWFAGQALVGDMACQTPDWVTTDNNILAKQAYKVADAMMKARQEVSQE